MWGIIMRFFSRRDKILEDKTNEGELRRKAEKGDPNAQFNLGRCFEKGKGVEQDKAEAARWYRKSADQGWAQAMNCLACLCYYGFGVEESDDEAFRLWKAAAELGEEGALENLAFCYEPGIGTKKNPEEAEKWYMRAQKARQIRAKSDPNHTQAQSEMEETMASLRRFLRNN